jgi:hypothetical protein
MLSRLRWLHRGIGAIKLTQVAFHLTGPCVTSLTKWPQAECDFNRPFVLGDGKSLGERAIRPAYDL